MKPKISKLLLECQINSDIAALADHPWSDVFSYSSNEKAPIAPWIAGIDITLRHPRPAGHSINALAVCPRDPPFVVKVKPPLHSLPQILDTVSSLNDARELVKSISTVSDSQMEIVEDLDELEESFTNEQLISNQYVVFFKPLANPVCETMTWYHFLKASLSMDGVQFQDWRYFQKLLGTKLPEDCHLFGLQLHLSENTNCALSQPFTFIAEIRDVDEDNDTPSKGRLREMLIPEARKLLQSTLPLMLLSRYSDNDLEDGKIGFVVENWMYVYGLIISPEMCRFFVLTPVWDYKAHEWGYHTTSLFIAPCSPDSFSIRGRMAGMMQSVCRNTLYLRSRLEKEVKKLESI